MFWPESHNKTWTLYCCYYHYNFDSSSGVAEEIYFAFHFSSFLNHKTFTVHFWVVVFLQHSFLNCRSSREENRKLSFVALLLKVSSFSHYSSLRPLLLAQAGYMVACALFAWLAGMYLQYVHACANTHNIWECHL